MGNRIEITFQVRVVHRLIPLLQVLANLGQGLRRIAPRSKPVGTILKIRFEDRLQDQQRGHLHHPIPHRGYPQRPLFPVGLGNVYASYRL